MFQFTRAAVCAAIAATVVVGCKAKEPAVDTATSAGAVAPATTDNNATIRVGDIDMGRSVKTDKSIDDKTDDFKPSDTIYASVSTNGIATNTPLTVRWTFQDGQVVDEKTETLTTNGIATNTPLTVRWTFQDGQVVDEKTETLTSNGEARTEFHISKAGGLPAGKYTIHVLVDGKEVKTKDIEVKK